MFSHKIYAYLDPPFPQSKPVHCLGDFPAYQIHAHPQHILQNTQIYVAYLRKTAHDCRPAAP